MRAEFIFLLAHFTLNSRGKANSEFPSFDRFHSEDNSNKQTHTNFEFIDKILNDQEMNDFHFGPKEEDHKGQEMEEINFGHKPDHPKGQEMEDFHFGPKEEDHKGQEMEEINFGHKPDHPKGQEMEDFHFGPKEEDHKGQEVEEINFGHKPDHPKGQEMEDFHFGPKEEDHKGQEVEEINFGHKPDHPKGQEMEDFHFGPKEEDHKGQEVEEINFGHKPDHPKGQEMEDFHFGPKEEDHKGQEVEEINFGNKPDHPKGQEMEDFHFGPKEEDHKGQEVEEINFGNKPDHPKGQEMEDFHFGPKEEDHKGQEVEEINFGSKPDHPKNQEVEEIFSGCLKRPKAPFNSVLKCDSDRYCEMTCQEGYRFSEGISKVEFVCERNEWFPTASDSAPFECSPICEPPCQNNGICIATNQCSCPKNFEGPNCQFQQKPCSNHPPVSHNSYVNCNSSDCLVKCFDNYFFPDGSSTAHLACHEGEWTWTRSDWNSSFECEPSCEPPCVNGGSCLDHNKCRCPRQYVGPQCQYDLFACDAKKLNFNGYYTCQGEADKVSCTLRCPDGHDADAPLAKEYVCFYSTGKFYPEPVPKCLYGENTEVIKFASSSHTVEEGFENFTVHQKPHHSDSPPTAECRSWKRSHYKNFDGKVFSFDGICSYILAQDVSGNSFRIVTEHSSCGSTCSQTLKIYYQDQEYELHFNGTTPVLSVDGESAQVPNHFAGISVEKMGAGILVFLRSIDVTINLSNQDDVSIRVNENFWNKTAGLCGNFNNDPNDDFYSSDGTPAWNLEIFLQSWIENAYSCSSTPSTRNNCSNESSADYCRKIFGDVNFEKCSKAGISAVYQEACTWDTCKCGESCACESISEFVKNCKNYLVAEGFPDSTSNWRRIADCPLDCPPGKVYSSCGPSFETGCGSLGATDGLAKYSECVEGCFCPDGLLQFNDSCVEKEFCPCKWRDEFYARGETIKKDCNTCVCRNGEWACTELKCPSRCSVVGNSHYRTFDGRRYDYTGRCPYYLLKSESFAITSESPPCEGDYANEIFHGFISKYSPCSKVVIIRHGADEIKLETRKEVLVNGVEGPSPPFQVNGVIVRSGSLHLTVTLPDGTEVWWDGNVNVHVDLPGNGTKSAAAGLCGTSNQNQRDDFMTPEGDVEEAAEHFARKWKADERCSEVADPLPPLPCDSNAKYRAVADKECLKLKSDAFKGCHPFVDVEPFYKNCLHDVCSCQKETKTCTCPIFADYASECLRHDIVLPWRIQVRECGLHCPTGQIYQPHGGTCARSCEDISMMKGRCVEKYAEGCSCPDGLVLDSKGQCVAVADCPCTHQNSKYKANHELIMEAEGGPQLCVCRNALWSCRPATSLELARNHENNDLKCNERLHEEYTSCEPAEPKTCKNMHERPKSSTRICFPGCTCKRGFVWDSVGESCVNASECPCHHGGRSYATGETIRQDCNSCTCEEGTWSCTERECSSICSAWGDSHFKTFDGKLFDFQGSCDFVLASGVISEFETFFVGLQIVPCGSTGISCPKAVTLIVGSPQKEEKVVFRNSNRPSVSGGSERILLREVGLFVFAHVFDLGIVVQWDRGTRVYVKADPRWKNKVKGLCGNFNGDDSDDFKTPTSGETSEISPILFADSWRLQPHCPESTAVEDTCGRRPHRKAWAVKKCSVLKSEVFEACHSEVPPEPHFERCLTDTCGCDEGGDCECMCTAVAAYAEECTRKGIPVKWRTQEFCPLQCHDDSTYSSCVPSCPPKSCDDQFRHSAMLQVCPLEPCVEGCERPRCLADHVLANSSSNVCVPITSCKTVCLTVNGVTYLEGDLMESDDCHSCFCSHHRRVCTGKPCHELTTVMPSPPSTSGCPHDQVWDACIVKCDRLCHHLRHSVTTELQCSHGDDCISGCRAIDMNCTFDMFLRDPHTCLQKKDCPCLSPSGLLVKPGDVVQESECEKCQCIDNEYECHDVCVVSLPTHPPTTDASFGYTKTRHTATPKWDFAQEGNVSLVHVATTTPSASCPNGLFESLVDAFTRFSASSHSDESSSPVFGQMSSKGFWRAGADDGDQYLQVDLGRVETIYAVVVAGDAGDHVNAYHLLHSVNGDKFKAVFDLNGKKEIFGGPLDGRHSVRQVLRAPFEARYIRFHPTSWHGRISMKVDVLGCRVDTSHQTTTAAPSACNGPIGIGWKRFPKLQVIATSSRPGRGPDFIGFDNERGWQPLTNSKSEWVQLDFGDQGNFTGIATRGVSQGNEVSSPEGESWVERFRVEYSHDGVSWNPVLDEFGDERIFTGNSDGETEKRNFFGRPIRARYLKIRPEKWHQDIGLRLDVMGCYETSGMEVQVPPPVEVSPECNVCPGAVLHQGECNCKGEEWWNGENCINRSECPCFVGLLSYPAGSTFADENCEECTCRPFGLSHCVPKLCQDCPNGLRKVLTPLCGCTCKPCEDNTRLCPTSNVCLEESAWCDGVQDCPDDETNCTTPAPKVTSTPCLASCPPGYDIIYKTHLPSEADDMLRSERPRSVKSKKSVKTYRKSKKIRKLQKLTECPLYDCAPIKEVPPSECPPPECPKDYSIVFEPPGKGPEGSCPPYTCAPVPEYANCTVSSKNIKTFDGVQLKYEICDHVMATHDSGSWNVSVVRNCSSAPACTTILLMHHGDHFLELPSRNSLLKVDSFAYSDDQVALLDSKTGDFSLNPLGNSLVFTSHLFGFQVVYDESGNFVIKVPGSAKGHLTGLCGLFNGQPTDDKTRADGNLAKSTVDFGDSWSNPGGRKCVEAVCPIEMQATALGICLKLKENPFNACPQQVNLEQCVESTCECLFGNRTADECRCQLLSGFAAKCKTASQFGWRVEHNCPPSCPPHLVHYSCYPYECQSTCGHECTEPATDCYSGCFCPDGLVKKGDQCIPVAECRDCICSGMGDSTYLTFDGSLTFNGNCTYVAAREKTTSDTPSFEVLIGNTLCNGSEFKTCTDKVEVKVPGHSIKLVAVPAIDEGVRIFVDGRSEDLPAKGKLERNWGEVEFNPGTSSVRVGLPREHVDVRFFFRRLAFTVSLPSHFYGGKVQGLCGTCDQSSEELEEVVNPELWQVEKDKECLIDPPTTCIPNAEQREICLLLNSTKIFGQCLAFVDPTPFVDQCLGSACADGDLCGSLETFGRACAEAGICVGWRSPDLCPFPCPADLEYQACKSGCRKTCEDEQPESECTSPPVEGCFCPQDQILINGTCRSEKYCEKYCDEEGQHHEDELWRPDKCTECSCKNHVVTCRKTECPGADITCEEDHIIVKEESAVECCPKYRCECKPREECPELEMPNELLPGMEAVVNRSGCCPTVEVLCKKETCPEPQPCKEHYIRRVLNTTNCCSDYFCEKPDNVCIYEFDEPEKTKSRIERGLPKEVIKEVGEQWSDGPCKTCICVYRNGLAVAVCTVTECKSLEEHEDFKEYVLEEVAHPGVCCPEVRRKACRHNGRTYEVGDSWMPDEANPCETIKCNRWQEAFVLKEMRLEVCNAECEPGWEYERSEGSCCGRCVQNGCFVDGQIYGEGHIWLSRDNCSRSTCVLKRGHYSITTETTTCPSVEDCPAEDIYQDECCLKCRIRPENKKICFPQLLPPESTVGLIKQKKGRRGECGNPHPIGNFTRCAGNCDSFTEYEPGSGLHKSVCSCCKPEEYSLLEVDLKCDDGSELKKKVTVPSKCSCMPCNG